jgi:hypothetical protein
LRGLYEQLRAILLRPFRLLLKTNFITRLTTWRRRRLENQQAIFAGTRKSFKQKYLFANAKMAKERTKPLLETPEGVQQRLHHLFF